MGSPMGLPDLALGDLERSKSRLLAYWYEICKICVYLMMT